MQYAVSYKNIEPGKPALNAMPRRWLDTLANSANPLVSAAARNEIDRRTRQFAYRSGLGPGSVTVL